MWPEIKTILLAMTPINELRGTIPIAIMVFHLMPIKAFFLAWFGNMLPILFLLWFWKYLAENWASRNRLIDKFLKWIFRRTRKRFYKKYSLYGDIALILFVAIPLPFTGAWTGSIAAFLFGISYGRGLWLIACGALIAGVIVTIMTTGIYSFL
ncbi:small multi-drug export protein [bacterium]|nr:small multi-drug export protein [bacterium]OQX71561.1 MAG: hypothetical protein B6D52_01050 [Candidatus Parcubacteria bacterium 4484_255]